MRKREMELREALGDAWTAARVTGGQFRQLGPVYADRMGLAYQVLRGRQIRKLTRAVAVTALVAAVSGAVTALVAERLITARREASTEPAEATPREVAEAGAVSG